MNGFLVSHNNLKGEDQLSEWITSMNDLQLYCESLIGSTFRIVVKNFKQHILVKQIEYYHNGYTWEKVL